MSFWANFFWDANFWDQWFWFESGVANLTREVVRLNSPNAMSVWLSSLINILE